jgi:cell division protein FtsL
MIVRSTQLRPSQQSQGADRAVAFANAASRRSASLDVAAQKSTTTPIRNSMVIPNPNRTTRRWGTVQIKETEAMRNARVEARELQLSAIRAARGEHPATGEARVATSRGSERLAARRIPSPRLGTPLPAGRTSSSAANASAATASARTHAETGRSNVVAMRRGTHASATTQPTTQPTTAGRATAAKTSATARASTTAATALTVSSANFGTDGATALAPALREARKSSMRRTKPDLKTANLRVARPQRRIARRTIARPASALFAMMLLVAGAVSAIVMHADLAKNQLLLDKVRVAVGTEERTNQRLRVEVAELEAPARIITAANQIGLVSAERVDYTPLSVSVPPK